MAYRDTAVDPIPRFPDAASLSAAPDWRRLYEQTLERAEVAEARAEELKWAEVAARSALGSLQWQLKEARRKRREAVEAANEARRVASNAFSLQAEVRRLKDLLADAGVASHRSSVIGLRREIVRLRKDVPRAEVQAREIRKLHEANRRLRVDQAAMSRLSRENAQLRRTVERLRRRTETRETELAKLRSTRAVLSKALYSPRSEKRERPGSGGPRGQVRGAPGHGRTQRPGLEERVEERNPPAAARTCGGCGKPHAAVGAERSALVEIEVKAHRRVIRRPRWRRTCDCAASPAEVLSDERPIARGNAAATGCRR